MSEQTFIEQIAERRGAKFRRRPFANVDADFYTNIPGKPRSEWKRVGLTSAGADIKKGKFPPCPLGVCSGDGLKLLKDTGHGRKTYGLCPCTKKRA